MGNMNGMTIGEIVAEDYRAASVFENYKIDFCCNGNNNLVDVCNSKNIDPEKLINEINLILQSNRSQAQDYQSWPLDLLTDYIEKKHHRYVEQRIPEIKQYLDKLCKVHGENHQELFEVKELFNQSAEQLTMHMKKEELILFPVIRKMTLARLKNEKISPAPFGTVENPIQMMMNEHSNEGDRFYKIEELTNEFKVPSDGCNTYMVTLSMLKEFQEDLHIHIHLENNILFPKAIELEKALISKLGI